MYVYHQTGTDHSSHKSCDNSVKTFWFRFSRNYPAQSTYTKYPCDYLRNLRIRLVSKLPKNEDSWRVNVWTDGSAVSADMAVNYSFLWYESVVATKVGGKLGGGAGGTLPLPRSWHRKVVQKPNELAYLEEAKTKITVLHEDFSPYLASWQTYISAW